MLTSLSMPDIQQFSYRFSHDYLSCSAFMLLFGNLGCLCFALYSVDYVNLKINLQYLFPYNALLHKLICYLWHVLRLVVVGKKGCAPCNKNFITDNFVLMAVILYAFNMTAKMW